MIQMSAILPNLFRHYQTFIVIHQRTIHCSTSCQFKAEPIITEKQQQHDRDLIAESLPQQAEHPQSPPQPIGGSCWWKKPVYYSPVVSPLERGPDFRFLDGRRPQITTVWELERRKKHVQLGKQIVMLLSELREAEELYEESKMRKTLQQEKIEQRTPKEKGNEEPF